MDTRHTVVAFVGASGTGKSSIMHSFAQRYPEKTHILRSITTRARRDLDGLEDTSYRFVTQEEFAETPVMESVYYDGNRYGLPRVEVEALVQRGSLMRLGLVVLTEEGVTQLRQVPWLRVIAIRVACRKGAHINRGRRESDLIRETNFPTEFTVENDGDLTDAVDKVEKLLAEYLPV